MMRRLLAALVSTGALLGASRALADDGKAPPGAPGASAGTSDTSVPDPGAKPQAADARSGHFYIRAGGDLEIPAGFLRSGVGINDVIGLGAGVDAALGVGLSRHAEVNVAGTYAFMQSAGRCPTCSGDHAALNLGFTYHLAQGVALDPWIRLAMGYRTANYQGAKGAPLSLIPGRFHGLDVADISLGGTFFPTPSFGIGPFLAANVGTYLSRPAPAGVASGSARAYAFFQLGLQIEFDPVRLAEKRGPGLKKSPKTAVSSPISY